MAQTPVGGRTDDDGPRPKEKALRQPVSRRAFLRFTLGAGTAGTLGAFGAATLGVMWPQMGEGFGATIDLGLAAELAAEIRSERAPFVYPQGRLYVITWDPSVPGAEAQYGRDHAVLGPELGLMALYQKCPHLGCRVPWCQVSQWFECPCHGSKYNRWGEFAEAPAPRGMDRFPSQVNGDGHLLVDTSIVLEGPARTARVLGQDPEGPHCISI